MHSWPSQTALQDATGAVLLFFSGANDSKMLEVTGE